ncbi:MAG: hypothetical protein ACR2MX_20015 [Cyclobacteriaceae bacterium]
MKYFISATILVMSIATYSQTPKVIINDVQLEDQQIQVFQNQYGIQMQSGNYWYDQWCGAWGIVGGPTIGFLLPGLQVGGPLNADASNGQTGVFVNGRELHAYDVVQLQKLIGQVYQGRYWLDARGNAGYEGGPALVNLWQASRNQQSNFYRNSYTGIGAGSSGGTSYVMGKDWSVIVDH